MAPSITKQVSLAIECVVLAGYLLLAIFAAILYFGRRSYKCILLGCVKQMAKSEARQRFANDVAQKWWLDLLVSSVFFVVLLRALSEVLRVLSAALGIALNRPTPVLDQLSSIALIISVTSYTFVFCALIWLWLRVSLTLFEEGTAKRNCMVWTVRAITIACIASTLLVNAALITLLCVPNLFKMAPVAGYVIFIGCLALYFLSMLVLSIVVVVLGIRIGSLIKRTTAALQGAGKRNDFDERAFAGRRAALAKISFAIAAFIIAFIVRAVGMCFMFLSVIPSYVSTLALLFLPEFITFGTLVVVLWPFKVKFCARYDADEVEITSPVLTQKLKVTVETASVSSPVVEIPMTSQPSDEPCVVAYTQEQTPISDNAVKSEV